MGQLYKMNFSILVVLEYFLKLSRISLTKKHPDSHGIKKLSVIFTSKFLIWKSMTWISQLTHFRPNIQFYIPSNHLKISGYLMFWWETLTWNRLKLLIEEAVCRCSEKFRKLRSKTLEFESFLIKLLKKEHLY